MLKVSALTSVWHFTLNQNRMNDPRKRDSTTPKLCPLPPMEI